MRLLGTTEKDLAIAGDAIARGLLVAIPTETVYGLGADAFDPIAVARIFEAKRRPNFDPLIVHIARIGDAERVAASIPAKARALMDALWPGPLTLILPKRSEVPDIVTSGLETVALRFPSHPVARRVIELSGTVVAAPSANPFGYLSPTTAEHVASMLGDKIDFIVDGGPCEVGVESTVLDACVDPPRVLRPGGMALDSIRRVIGDIDLFDRKVATPTSPGQLESHYAPHAALYLFEYGSLPAAAKPGLIDPVSSIALAFDRARGDALRECGLFEAVECLSERGDAREAAARLFSILHRLDAEGRTQIWAEKIPAEGLGAAVNDRLYKASRK
ncbi:MAG: L-threonylcarbamoyladenylate synthase [Rectinema sp.]